MIPEGKLMQRSKVLTIISKYGLSIEMADALLSDLEFIGMFPPETYMKGMPEVEGNKVVLEWDDEDEDVPYGKSVVEEVNADIKKLNDIAISSAHTLTLEKLLTAKEKLSTIE
jgi:hypothetical protein